MSPATATPQSPSQMPDYVTLPTRAERVASISYDYASQPKVSIEACNLSGGSTYTVITHQDRYGFPAQAVFWQDSGLVTFNPRLTADAYGPFYGGIYRPLVSAYHGRLINHQTLQSEQQLYAEQLVKFLTPFITSEVGNPPKQLLDIGGSTGVVARAVGQAFDYQATVLDPAPDELRDAAELGFSVIPGFLEDLDANQAGTFDLILLCQTIDHLLDVKGSLEKIRSLLKPNGLFFVDIVDFRGTYLKHHSVIEAIKIDHPYYLVEETMEAYLKQVGFGVSRKNYAPDGIHIGYVTRLIDPTPHALPDRAWIDSFQRELRWVQNTPRVKP
jgi:SAM-dependent methyltransferase